MFPRDPSPESQKKMPVDFSIFSITFWVSLMSQIFNNHSSVKDSSCRVMHVRQRAHDERQRAHNERDERQRANWLVDERLKNREIGALIRWFLFALQYQCTKTNRCLLFVSKLVGNQSFVRPKFAISCKNATFGGRFLRTWVHDSNENHFFQMG